MENTNNKYYKTSKFLENIDVDTEELKLERMKFIKSKFNDINDDDSLKIAEIINRRLKNEDISYKELPPILKNTVNQIIVDTNTLSSTAKKDNISKYIIDEFISDFNKSSLDKLDTMLSDFDKEYDEFQSNVSSEMGEMILNMDKDRNAAIDEAIKKCEDENDEKNLNKLKNIKEGIDIAFNLNIFKEFCKNCKIKNFDIKKPSRVFDIINDKYINHKSNINDISKCPLVLSKHIKKYNDTQNLIVCLAFCKYCIDKSPDNFIDHSIMHYFIRNILLLDRLNPGGKKSTENFKDEVKYFYNEFIKNISECIDNLLERNPSYK